MGHSILCLSLEKARFLCEAIQQKQCAILEACTHKVVYTIIINFKTILTCARFNFNQDIDQIKAVEL